MISFEEAKNLLNERLKQLPAESPSQVVSLSEALGRITAEPILAPISVPLFDNSAMDGFAVRSADVEKASPNCPVTLQIDGEARAGDPLQELGRGTIRIMTGAPLPLHTDAVIMKEEVIEKNGEIVISRPVAAGKNIRRMGEDFKAGDTAIPAGTKVTPGVLALMASIGRRDVRVTPQPRVSVIVTGHELVTSVTALKDGKILESNSVFLNAALSEIGISPVRNAVTEDDPAEIRNCLAAAFENSDVVIVTGGVSVGDHDHTRHVLEQLGVTPLFWKVAQKPGKPLYVGILDSSFATSLHPTQKFADRTKLITDHLAGGTAAKTVFGLPGNPFAVFVCFYLYIRPALLTLMGDPRPELKRGRLKLSRGIFKNDARTNFLKGKTVGKNGGTLAEPLKGQGSHLLGALTETDILIHVPMETTEIKEGEEVEVIHLP